jgi:hypothetical protein
MRPSRPSPMKRALRELQRWWILGAAVLAAVALVITFSTWAFHKSTPSTGTPRLPRVAPGRRSPVPVAAGDAPAPIPTARTDRHSAAAPSPLRRDSAASFERLRAGLPGRVQVALQPLGGGAEVLLGGDDPAHGWSTTKVPVLVALLRARGALGLTASERNEAHAAITASDNQSILDLFGDLESIKGGLVRASKYVQNLLRTSGDGITTVAIAPPPPGAVTTFGQTEWAPGEAVKFFRALALGRLLPAEQTAYVLHLMEHIVPSESWGLGAGRFTVPVAFKGGWGPEPSGAYLVRQSGIIDPGSSRGLAVSIVAYPPAGADSFAAGTDMLTRTAEWLRAELLLSNPN